MAGVINDSDSDSDVFKDHVPPTQPSLSDGRKYQEARELAFIKHASGMLHRQNSFGTRKIKQDIRVKREPVEEEEHGRSKKKKQKKQKKSSRFSCASCSKVFTDIDEYKHHSVEHIEVLNSDHDNSSEDIIMISSGLSSVEVSPVKDKPESRSSQGQSQEMKPNVERLKMKSRHLLRTDDSESYDLTVDSSSDHDSSQEEMETKKPRQLLVDRMLQFTICDRDQCASPYAHFHADARVELQQAVLSITSSEPELVCQEVPVNLRKSKCLLLDTSKLADPADCTSDEMPWVKQKGTISKQYVLQNKNGKPFRIWPKGKERKLPNNCEVVKAYKSVWIHSLVKDAVKTMFKLEGNSVVLIQYTGLNNQPELKMGNRRVRPSTTKLVTSALLDSRSTKRIVHNVTKKVSRNDYTAPSALPTYRSVTYAKEKRKKEEKKSAFVDLCHKMAEEDDSFIRCHQVSGNVVSVVLYNKQQLCDVQKFCTNAEYPCSALGIDTTFQFGNFYVVTSSYRHPFLKNREGNFPIILGPVMVTHRLRRESYRVLFDNITRDAPELANELKAFVTDGEVALQQAAAEAFPCAISLMCLTHMERNIKYRIRNVLKLSLQFFNIVIKDVCGDEFCEGLIHTQTYEEYTNSLGKLKTKWNNMEKEEVDQREPQFYSYFEQHKAKHIYDHCRVKLAKDIHLASEIPDNNPPESMHAVMRRWQDGIRKDIPAFVEDMKDLVESQQMDVKHAFLGNTGPYSLRDEYDEHRLVRESLYGEGITQEVDFDALYENVEVKTPQATTSAQQSTGIISSRNLMVPSSSWIASNTPNPPPAAARLPPAASPCLPQAALRAPPAALRAPPAALGAPPAALGAPPEALRASPAALGAPPAALGAPPAALGAPTAALEAPPAVTVSLLSVDPLTHITKIQKTMLVNRANKVSYRQGFTRDTLIFPKAGSQNQGFWTTSLCKGTYLCKCASFKAFNVCEHTLIHASKDKNLDSFVKLTSRKACNPDGIANMNANDNAGRKGGVRVRKGRSTDVNRVPLLEAMEDVDEATSNYNVKLTGPLRVQFTSSQPAVKKRPEMPIIPPTLGEPFYVKPVAGTNIRSCFGCQGPLCKTDICVAHKQTYAFFNNQQEKWVKTVGNKHFHYQNDCIRAGNNPSFDESMLVYQ